MAVVKLAKNGYGQLEINNGAFRRDGRIEAQCTLASGVTGENGMLVCVDGVNHVMSKATAALISAYQPVAILYSAEHLYESDKLGLKNFVLTDADVRPRAGYLAVGDKIYTNTVCYDEADYATMSTIISAVASSDGLFAAVAGDGSGYWQLYTAASAPAGGPMARVCEVGTMPDGQTGLKLQVVRA